MNPISASYGQALAIFAHELREPLASILLAVRGMTESPSDDPANREMCGIVDRQGQYLARMIDDALEVCRSSCDKQPLRKEWFDLRAVLASAIEATTPQLKRLNHALTVLLPQSSLYMMADALRVQQIVINLLTNAAKYTPAGGFIRLSVEVSDELVLIEVRDNGVGISAPLLPRVFDLFQQGTDLPSSGFSGLGIGLALVKSLVELHEGSVSAHSDGVGTGTAFVVRLPGASPRNHPARSRRPLPEHQTNASIYRAASPISDA